MTELNITTEFNLGGMNLTLDIYHDEDGKFLGGNCLHQDLRDSCRVIEFNRELIVDLYSRMFVIYFTPEGTILEEYAIIELGRSGMSRVVTDKRIEKFQSTSKVFNFKEKGLNKLKKLLLKIL